MTNNSFTVFLTYKGKVLLLSKENKLDTVLHNPWGLFEKQTEKSISGKEVIIKEVLKEAKIKLSNLTSISLTKTEQVFHAHLTDFHVNSIQRDGASLMQFYSLNELQKLHLQDSTRLIFTKYKSKLEAIMN